MFMMRSYSLPHTLIGKVRRGGALRESPVKKEVEKTDIYVLVGCLFS